jgi:hypothetical protein
VPATLPVERGKCEQSSVDAACDDGSGSRRIFVTDAYELFAANGMRISTYDTTLVSLDLALRRVFKWRFVDVTTPIIGVDFLSIAKSPRNILYPNKTIAFLRKRNKTAC